MQLRHAEPAAVPAAAEPVTRRRVRREVVGLAGVLVAFIAIGAMFAFQQPPFVAPDETAHLGYAQEIADFRLPEIDQAPDIPDSARQWLAEAESRKDDRYRGVWVANHPPLNYVVVAPLMWWSELTDRSDGGLLYLRLANVLFAAVGVVFTYLLGKELSGGVARIGLAAAAVAALVPQGHVVFSEGLNDGLGFAAGTALVWSGACCVRRGVGRRQLWALGATAAAAVGARAATMLLTIAVVGFVAVVELVRREGSRRIRLRAAVAVVAAGLLPAAVLFGWFYVRNQVLYGDIGASDYLLRLFRRRRRGSVLEMMTRGNMWVNLYQRLLSPSTLRRRVPTGLTVTAVVATIGAAAAIVVGRSGDRTGEGRPGRISRPAVGLGAFAILVIAVTVAQHVSGGGNAYARYLFPVLGVLAVFVVIGLDRLVPRVLPVALVALMGWWALLNIPTNVNAARIKRPRDSGRSAPELLQVLPASDGWRVAAAAFIVVGCAAAGVVLILGIVRPRDRSA